MTKTFGTILKEARKRKGMKSTQAAMELGMQQSQYSKYEKDLTKKFTLELFKKICLLFELDANKVLGLVVVTDSITDSYTIIENKQSSLIKKLQSCIVDSKVLQNHMIDEQLSKIKLTDSEISIQHDQIGYTIGIFESNRFTSLCCMLTVFILEMLKQIDKAAEINGGLDAAMTQVYLQWKNLLMVDILS